MRPLLAMLVIGVALAHVAPASAEKRIFIIANDGNGYGVDRCLASGEACGAAAASAYCRSREFKLAASYRKVDREEITGAVPSGAGCSRGNCDDFVAIECSR